MSSGVLSGLQNLYEGLRASRVGSIPTHSRQFYNDLTAVCLLREVGCSFIVVLIVNAIICDVFVPEIKLLQLL